MCFPHVGGNLTTVFFEGRQDPCPLGIRSTLCKHRMRFTSKLRHLCAFLMWGSPSFLASTPLGSVVQPLWKSLEVEARLKSCLAFSFILPYALNHTVWLQILPYSSASLHFLCLDHRVSHRLLYLGHDEGSPRTSPSPSPGCCPFPMRLQERHLYNVNMTVSVPRIEVFSAFS